MQHQQSSAGDGNASVSASQTSPRPAFSDRRAFVVRHTLGHAQRPLDKLFTEQGEDDPTFIHVGARCSDSYLREVWHARKRFPDLTLDQLIDVRDGRANMVEVAA